MPFTDAKAKYATTQQSLRLLSKNKINLALIYEKVILGLEGYFAYV
ncbi:hypothetical protein [Flavobacterium phycosphaerae]|nr:hypothetical protein [Flavobacterium phycosphaerae]